MKSSLRKLSSNLAQVKDQIYLKSTCGLLSGRSKNCRQRSNQDLPLWPSPGCTAAHQEHVHSTQHVSTELLPDGYEGLSAGICCCSWIASLNSCSWMERIPVYSGVTLWVPTSSRHFTSFISFNFHYKPVRTTGIPILQVRKQVDRSNLPKNPFFNEWKRKKWEKRKKS